MELVGGFRYSDMLVGSWDGNNSILNLMSPFLPPSHRHLRWFSKSKSAWQTHSYHFLNILANLIKLIFDYRKRQLNLWISLHMRMMMKDNRFAVRSAKLTTPWLKYSVTTSRMRSSQKLFAQQFSQSFLTCVLKWMRILRRPCSRGATYLTFSRTIRIWDCLRIFLGFSSTCTVNISQFYLIQIRS